MFNGYGYQPQCNPTAYPQSPYQQRMDFLQSAQPAQMQPQQSGLQARPVTCREEAVAATVFPGSPMVFLDRAHGMAYYKAVDAQTNSVEFVDLAVVMPAQQPAQPTAQQLPQYATLADIEAIRGEMAQLREMIPPPRRQQKGADAE